MVLVPPDEDADERAVGGVSAQGAPMTACRHCGLPIEEGKRVSVYRLSEVLPDGEYHEHCWDGLLARGNGVQGG